MGELADFLNQLSVDVFQRRRCANGSRVVRSTFELVEKLFESHIKPGQSCEKQPLACL